MTRSTLGVTYAETRDLIMKTMLETNTAWRTRQLIEHIYPGVPYGQYQSRVYSCLRKLADQRYLTWDAWAKSTGEATFSLGPMARNYLLPECYLVDLADPAQVEGMARDMTDEMTPGQLYDRLQEMFGIGNSNDLDYSTPYWKLRNTEIAKIKAMLKRRRTSPEELLLAADYARRMKSPISASWQVFELVPDALRDRKKREKAALGDELTEAVSQAVEAGEAEWAEQLMRTDARDIPEALERWRNR